MKGGFTINENQIEQGLENWAGEVGVGLKEAGVGYFSIIFKGVKEVISVGYMGKKDRQKIILRLLVYTLILIAIQLNREAITIIYSDFLSQHFKSFLLKLLYNPKVTDFIALLIGLNYFYGIGVKRKLEEDEISDLFEEIKFFTGKKKAAMEGDKKIMVPATPRLIRKIQRDRDTRIYMFQSKGILPEEWEKRKAQLEYIFEGKIVNIKRGNKKSINLIIVTEEKFEEMTEFYKRIECFDENFERMNLIGKGTREIEIFGEIKKTKNFPLYVEESDEVINSKEVITTTFKSSGLTLDDFKVKRYEYENVMNRLVVEISQDKLDKQLYRFRTIDTKDELKELYEWSLDIIDERDGVLVLGEGRLAKVILDLNQTPHVLVGGVTGSGKSVEMNCLIYQGIRKGWYPILVDFKGGLELGMFKDFSKFGVLFEAKKVLEVLKKLNKEHKARLEEFKNYPGVKNIVEYNERVPEELRLARIILGIDEVGELLDTSGKSKADKAIIEAIEGEINSMARLSRSTGINILTGTQRPDSNVLKGQIKNNLGARICGRMTDKEPSIMVLGSPDATKLPEDVKGRYMFSVGSDPVIMQGYYFKERDIVKGDYLKGRLLTIDTSDSSKENDKSDQSKKSKTAEPYEDFEEKDKKEPVCDSTNQTQSREEPLEDNTDETLKEEDNNKGAKTENLADDLKAIIASTDQLTLRALKVTGADHETLLNTLLALYKSEELEVTKQEQLKLLLFKEKKLSSAEYSQKKTNAEPIL